MGIDFEKWAADNGTRTANGYDANCKKTPAGYEPRNGLDNK